jgi:DHA1 family inner membrane transport protein
MIDRRLAALCFGNFVIGTGTMAVPGMLPALARGLDVSIPDAGRLIAAFALTICVFGPGLAGFASRFDRRPLLVAMLAIYCIGHLASAFAPDYATLLGTRVVSAVCAGLFTSQAAGAAGLMVAPEKRGAAVAFVFLGWSIAAVAGMPLSAWISETTGWRAAFAVVATLSLGAALWVHTVTPAGLRVQAVDGAVWLRLARNRTVLVVVAVTAVHSWGQFTVFSYMTPIAQGLPDASALGVSLLLALFGVTGIAGNVLAMRAMDRTGAAAVVMTSLVLMSASHLILAVAGHGLASLVAALALWGAGCFAINSAQQARLFTIEPALAPVSIALNSSAIYLGQAAGAESGARIIDASGFAPLTWLSLPVLVAAMLLSASATRRSVR